MEPMQPSQQPEQDEASGVKEAIIGVNSGMMKVKDVIANVPQIPDQLKAQLDNLIQQYQSFVKAIGEAAAGGGEPAPEQPAPEMEKKPPMRGPMPMSGGPNARPAL